ARRVGASGREVLRRGANQPGLRFLRLVIGESIVGPPHEHCSAALIHRPRLREPPPEADFVPGAWESGACRSRIVWSRDSWPRTFGRREKARARWEPAEPCEAVPNRSAGTSTSPECVPDPRTQVSVRCEARAEP